MATIRTISVTAAGGTTTIDVTLPIPDFIALIPDAATTTLGADFALTLSADPSVGTKFKVFFKPTVARNGHNFTILGGGLTQIQLNTGGYYEFEFLDGAGTFSYIYTPADLTIANSLDGHCLTIGSVLLEKLYPLTRGYMIVGDASAVPTAFAKGADGRILQSNATDLVWNPVSGDITITNAGVTAIGAGKVTNSMIAAATAIARNKLAALTASKVMVTDASGFDTTANQLSALLGGTAIDTSASTGFPQVAAGTWSVGAMTTVINLNISWEAGGTM